MPKSSPATIYIVEGLKISLDIMKDISGDLPPPVSSIVNLAIRVIAVIETFKKNKEKCDQLRDRILRILPVIAVIIKDSARGKKTASSVPLDLRQNVERLELNLEAISKQVEETQAAMKSKRIRRKVAAVFLGNEHAATLQQCHDDLDWAMKEFDVLSRVGDAVRLCEVLEKVRTILANQVFQSLPRAKYAGYDSERPDKPSSCFEGTRTAILRDIAKWMKDPDSSVERVFWLSGIAGVGKTTVARTIAEQAQEAGILGGQFFFSRKGEAALRDPALVFTTIAYQLARHDPEFGQRIIAALEADPDIPFASLKNQLDKFIIEPLSDIKRDPKRVVVIIFDAFDECEAKGAKEILHLLVNAIPSLPFFLKILLTSRPEPHIRSVLLPGDNLHITALHDIEASIVEDDIKLYLTSRLRDLPKELDLPLPPDWVKEHEIDILADKAGNLFIHAATSLRFLLEAVDLIAQLKSLLKIVESNRRSSKGDMPFSDLDKLYLEILCGTMSERNEAEMVRMLQPVLGTLVLLRDPLSVDALSSLIGLSSSNISATLGRLSSVVLLPTPPDHCPRVYHPSFPDFLQDDTRCTDAKFHIDVQVHEQRMALNCLHLINSKLRRGMLGDLDPAILNRDLPDLNSKIQGAFSAELQYACRYWPSHLAAVVDGSDPVFMQSLEQFSAKSLLPWIEAMSWLGEVRLCLTSLDTVNSWVAKRECSAPIKSLLNDGHRMVLAHFPAITLSAQHIARSVFHFLPRNIAMVSQYQDYADTAVRVLYGLDDEWPACLMAMGSHTGRVNAVAFSPDGVRLASGGQDKVIRLWDAVSGGSLALLEGHSEGVNSVAYSPDGTELASGSNDKDVRVWDVISGRCLAVLKGHTAPVNSVAFNPDSSRHHVASGSDDETIRIWDASSGSCRATLVGHNDWVMSVAFSLDGSRLASGSADGTKRLWNADNATYISTLDRDSGGGTCVAFSPAADGFRLAGASYGNTIHLWDVNSSSRVATLTGHAECVNCVAFSPDGQRLASGSGDNSIHICDTTNATRLVTLDGHSDVVSALTFSPDGSRLVSASHDGTVRIWDASSSDNHAPSKAETDWVNIVAFSPDGSVLASAYNDRKIRLQDTSTGSCLATLPCFSIDYSLAFSPDSSLLANGSYQSIGLWDTRNATQLMTLSGHSFIVGSLAFSSDGSRLASGSNDEVICIWNTNSGVCLTRLRGSAGPLDVSALAFSPDDTRLVSGSSDHTVRLWDVVTGSCLATFAGYFFGSSSLRYSSGVAFSPTGSQIFSRSEGGAAFVWDIPTGERLGPGSHEESGSLSRLHLQLEAGRLVRKGASGVNHLLCFVPSAYVVSSVDFAVFGSERTRVALGCVNTGLLLVEIVS